MYSQRLKPDIHALGQQFARGEIRPCLELFLDFAQVHIASLHLHGDHPPMTSFIVEENIIALRLVF